MELALGGLIAVAAIRERDRERQRETQRERESDSRGGYETTNSEPILLYTTDTHPVIHILWYTTDLACVKREGKMRWLSGRPSRLRLETRTCKRHATHARYDQDWGLKRELQAFLTDLPHSKTLRKNDRKRGKKQTMLFFESRSYLACVACLLQSRETWCLSDLKANQIIIQEGKEDRSSQTFGCLRRFGLRQIARAIKRSGDRVYRSEVQVPCLFVEPLINLMFYMCDMTHSHVWHDSSI